MYVIQFRFKFVIYGGRYETAVGIGYVTTSDHHGFNYSADKEGALKFASISIAEKIEAQVKEDETVSHVSIKQRLRL
jgi:hypothetical protein